MRPSLPGDPRDYPPRPIMPIEVPLWTCDQYEEFLRIRFGLHRAALAPGLITPCTVEDIWKDPDKWAVKKKRNKRAVRVFTSVSDAGDFAFKCNYPTEIKRRAGIPKRCLKYCRVAQFCPQYQAMKETITIDPDISIQ